MLHFISQCFFNEYDNYPKKELLEKRILKSIKLSSKINVKMTEESTVYALGQTDEGKNVLIEIIHPIEGETEYKSYPLEDGMNSKGNEILQFLKEYNLIHEHTQEDYIKMAAKYAKAKGMLYDNQLIAIKEKEESTITSTDGEIR